MYSKKLKSTHFQVRGVTRQSYYLENTFPYLALPESYLGNQLKSYGGYISFVVRYENEDTPLQAPHIIIVVSNIRIKYKCKNLHSFRCTIMCMFDTLQGNGKKLVSGGSTFSPHAENKVHTQFAVGSWFHEGDELIVSANRNLPASREDIMTVLANLEYILIKLVFCRICFFGAD